MNVKEKLNMDLQGLIENGPITIVAFGDSVTHGAVAAGEMNYETVYWNRLRQKMNALRNYVPVNVINAGIGGITAGGSLSRLDSQVLAHNPDLVIVCFGLNDVNGSLEDYLSALRTIFTRIAESGAEQIFMTPNMLNTYVAEDAPAQYLDYAKVTADMQNSGKMDKYIAAAIAVAKEMQISVCDCYSKWKALAMTQDVTYLLANRINHPTSEMHELFADALYELIMSDAQNATETESTMFKNM